MSAVHSGRGGGRQDTVGVGGRGLERMDGAIIRAAFKFTTTAILLHLAASGHMTICVNRELGIGLHGRATE